MKILFPYLLLFLACEGQPSKVVQPALDNQDDTSYIFPYDLANVEDVWLLDNQLIEVSGLTYCSLDSSIWAINDEKAWVYQLDSSNGQILDKRKFGSKGDYEGVECIDNIRYILKSNGNIYKFKEGSEKAELTKTELSTANDVEGLGYDKSTNQLILACKGSPALEDHPKKKIKKAFYSFDLTEERLNQTPIFEIYDSMLIDFVEGTESFQLMGATASKKINERLKSFAPSAISIHPASEDYYILSSVGKLLVVYNLEEGIKHVEFLDKNIHYQPEGLCFNASNDMLIANEGKGLKAKVHVFKSRSKS